jgi:hypothetical protein
MQSFGLIYFKQHAKPNYLDACSNKKYLFIFGCISLLVLVKSLIAQAAVVTNED